MGPRVLESEVAHDGVAQSMGGAELSKGPESRGVGPASSAASAGGEDTSTVASTPASSSPATLSPGGSSLPQFHVSAATIPEPMARATALAPGRSKTRLM